MHVDYEVGPQPGEAFRFTLVEAQAPVEITYFVGNRPYGEERCEHIPCELVLTVPVQTSGEFLRLVAEDTAGSDVFRLRIGENG